MKSLTPEEEEALIAALDICPPEEAECLDGRTNELEVHHRLMARGLITTETEEWWETDLEDPEWEIGYTANFYPITALGRLALQLHRIATQPLNV